MPSATSGITTLSSSASAGAPGRRACGHRWSGARRRGSGVGTGRRGSGVGRQHRDLVAGHRAAQVRHRPAGGEDLRLVLAGAAQHELALAEPGDRRIDRGDVDAAGSRRHPVEQAGLVAVGLQAADHPRAGVRHRLVVEVDRVLRRQHHADAERPGLLHQRHDRLLRRRLLGGREVAGHLVHVEHRPQVGRAALAAHPRDQLRRGSAT